MQFRFEIKEALVNGNIARALGFFGNHMSPLEDNYDRPFDSDNYSVLFFLLVYNPNQRNKIKEEISRLFKENPWIFNIPENKNSLINFLIEKLIYTEWNLNYLKKVNDNSISGVIETFSDILFFFLTLGFPELDLTPYKDFFVEKILESFQISLEKEETNSKKIVELTRKIRNLEIFENKNEGVLRSETIKEIIKETIKETLKTETIKEIIREAISNTPTKANKDSNR